MAINNRGLWPYTVQVGDVLVDAKGTMRIVRYATQGESGYTTTVDLAILRCSWTRRPYTVLNYVDLKHRGFRPTGVRVNLAVREIDRMLAKDCEDFNSRSLYSWDVIEKGMR